MFSAGREYCVIVSWSFGWTIQLFLDTKACCGAWWEPPYPIYSHSLGEVEDRDDDNVDALSDKEELFYF